MNILQTHEQIRLLTELAQSCAHLDGDAAELGVYQGGSAKVIAKALPHKILHLFDTFAGIPHDDSFGSHRKGDFPADEMSVREYLSDCNVQYHVGIFPATAVDGLQFCFVHLDADLYQSTLDAIDYFWPRMVSGGVIVFHDWAWSRCAGVERAIKEKGLAVQVRGHQAWATR